MSRAYTVATVALALDVDSKWVDNVLSRNTVTGVDQSRQGVARKITQEGVIELSLVKSLTEEMHVPLEFGLERAHALATTGEWLVGDALIVQLDRSRLIHEIEERLEYAVEATPVPRRGRPPANTKRGAD